jgi:hypothetical protein
MSKRAKFVAAAIILMTAFDACAESSPCETELNKSKQIGDLPLPKACAKFGPLSLGMSRPDVEAIIGAPNILKDWSPQYEVAWYVYPRGLEIEIAKHPVTMLSFTTLSLVYSEGKLVTIDSIDNERTGFNHETFRNGRNIKDIRNSVKSPIFINRPHDYATTNNWPIGIGLDESSGNVVGLRIATTMTAYLAGGGLSLKSKPDERGLISQFDLVPR